MAGAAGLVLTLAPTDSASAAPTPTSRWMGVPMYHQQLADDCEAASLRMILAYRGHHYTDQQLLQKIGVDSAHPRFGTSGPKTGDPYRAFVGNPNGDEGRGTGYGVFYPRIAAAARASGARVLVAQEGYAPWRLYQQLAAGHPAVVWIDYLYRAKQRTWDKAYDGHWVPYAGPAEHAVALIGVTKNGVYVNDPARGAYWIPKAKFEAGYSTYGDMAVVIA
ncbi:C39 family peptidase [Streptacidiphilus sp. EB129]|uniref:C39 family peptidase n=1 Tax=Streptacidiphilus sp. EB129 TaxID=3156262 RepID=UPI00351300A9